MPKTRFKQLQLEKSVVAGHPLTYGEIAEGAGLSESTVERYANDRFQEPTWHVVKALAAYFGVSDDYFMLRSEQRDAGEGVELGQPAAVATA